MNGTRRAPDRGFTLIEFMVGLAAAAILAAVCARVLLLGIMTFNFAVRQSQSLDRNRKVLGGDGARIGVLEASREAYAFSSVSASSVAVLSAPAVLTNYYVSGGNLYHATAGKSALQSDGITSLALNYYMSTGGRISSTTVVSSAAMVTALVTLGAGTSAAQKTYTLYSGAQLRNHP